MGADIKDELWGKRNIFRTEMIVLPTRVSWENNKQDT